MDKELAIKTIEDNFWARPGTFMYFFNERKTFSVEQFDQLYTGIKTMVDDNSFRTLIEYLPKINDIYQNIIKTMIYHFDKNDPFTISGMPDNYGKYIEQMYGLIGKYNCKLKKYSTGK